MPSSPSGGDSASQLYPADAASSGFKFSEVCSTGERLFWLEGQSSGTYLICRPLNSKTSFSQNSDRLQPFKYQVKASIGYGGGAFTAVGQDVVFVEKSSQELYHYSFDSGTTRPITAIGGAVASPQISPCGTLVLFVHHNPVTEEDRLLVGDLAGLYQPVVVASGADFYTQPRWHPCGRLIAYVSWHHPDMPWDNSHLNLVGLTYRFGGASDLPKVEGTLQITANNIRHGIFQPEFSKDGDQLFYISDESGLDQIHTYDLTALDPAAFNPAAFNPVAYNSLIDNCATAKSSQLTSFDRGDCGLPNWQQNMRTYAVGDSGRCLLVVRSIDGFDSLHKVDWATGSSHPCAGLDDFGELSQIHVVPTFEPAEQDDPSTKGSGSNTQVSMIGSAWNMPPKILTYSCSQAAATVWAQSCDPRLSSQPSSQSTPPRRIQYDTLRSTVLRPEHMTWRTRGGEEVYGHFYRPNRNSASKTPSLARCDQQRAGNGDTKPPVIVFVHVGPTAQAKANWQPLRTYFLSRGYAMLYPNYRGSTGYGRAYQQRLNNNWGVFDVEDCVTGLQYLVDSQLVDGRRAVILGGSSGGYTVLQAMTDHPEVFNAGVSYYGIANLLELSSDTHKFERYYNHSLIGSLPECTGVYEARSPLNKVDRIVKPLALFHGSDDQVVPASQTAEVARALKDRHIPHLHYQYEGEGHGWRQRATTKHFLETIEKFLEQTLSESRYG